MCYTVRDSLRTCNTEPSVNAREGAESDENREVGGFEVHIDFDFESGFVAGCDEGILTEHRGLLYAKCGPT
jgi:hypothetical protein